jgi:hypothetical protein
MDDHRDDVAEESSGGPSSAAASALDARAKDVDRTWARRRL